MARPDNPGNRGKPPRQSSELNPRPRKTQFVVKLSVEGYRDFGRFMTEKDSTGNRRYTYAKNQLKSDIEGYLTGRAPVYEDCGTPSERTWGKQEDGTDLPNGNKDKIKIEKDDGSPADIGGGRNYPISVPREICEDANGDIDLDYLISYVQGLNSMSDEDAAYSLLGMYFLSRCR